MKMLTKCGHRCPCKCGEKCNPEKCAEPRSKMCPDCREYYDIKCCDYEKDHCPKPCQKTLACGHLCHGTCDKCHKGGVFPTDYTSVRESAYGFTILPV